MRLNNLSIVIVLMFSFNALNAVSAIDLYYSEITEVTDETRYVTLHPEAILVPLDKLRHVKGYYVFSAGERITGDRLIVTHLDESQFTKAVDIETIIRYPAVGYKGASITRTEIYVDLSGNDADAYFTEGGIEKTYAEILLTCNQTRTFTYELFIYGY